MGKTTMSNDSLTQAKFDEAVEYLSNDFVDYVLISLLKDDVNGVLNVNKKYGLSKDTLLHTACVCLDNKILANLLLEKKASVNIQNLDGNTPLMHVCISSIREYTLNLNDVSCFEDYKLKLNDKLFERDTILLLINNGADVNISNIFGETPLYIACYHRNIELVKLLLANGADPNLQTTKEKKEIPLHCACMTHYGHYDIIRLLLDGGSNINIQDVNGMTPLHIACIKSDLDVVMLFFDRNSEIDTRIEDNSNKTALDYIRIKMTADSINEFVSAFQEYEKMQTNLEWEKGVII